MLFEKRLGGNLYRPIGMEWAEQGYWKVYDHPATQAQFLSIGGATPDGSQPLNETEGRAPINGVYLCRDIHSESVNKAITLDAFFKLPIDIVIASIPQHIEPFQRLCLAHPNKPKFIFQIGNQWNLTGHTKMMPINVMASARIPAHQRQQADSFIEYHQEFYRTLFDSPHGFEEYKTVSSFVNCFSIDGLFAYDWQLFQEVEKLMPDWSFKSYGGQCRDGGKDQLGVLTTMAASRFIWHTKNGGDGYGHVLHTSGDAARPLIIKRQYYIGKMGDDLIKDGKTAIVIDALSPEEIKNKIEYYSEPERWHQMCHNVRDNFDSVVNFDAEFLGIKQFLDNLL